MPQVHLVLEHKVARMEKVKQVIQVAQVAHQDLTDHQDQVAAVAVLLW